VQDVHVVRAVHHERLSGLQGILWVAVLEHQLGDSDGVVGVIGGEDRGRSDGILCGKLDLKMALAGDGASGRCAAGQRGACSLSKRHVSQVEMVLMRHSSGRAVQAVAVHLMAGSVHPALTLNSPQARV
jgi:hypothetical protein